MPAFLHDRTRAEKADAGDDLCAETSGVAVDRAGIDGDQILAGQHHERGADCDQHMGAQSGGTVCRLPLYADQCADENGRAEADQ